VRVNRRDVLAGAASITATLLAPGANAQATAPLRRPIPSSGEQIPVLGLGTARRYDVRSDSALPPLRDTLKTFQQVGCSVIDTAPVYGTAEPTVGKLVAGLGIRDRLFLATKVSTSGRESGARQIEQSFKSLDTAKIDLIAVHNLRDTQVHLPTLRDLKQAGRIRYIGITTSFDGQREAFADVMGKEKLDFIQIDYALDNRGAADRILPLARERGTAVMINLPFGRGRLFAATKGKALPTWASEFDCASWAQFFLKYILAQEAVTCIIPGMAKPEYVVDNVAAARGRLPDAAMCRRMETLVETL
jgi:aryl-alcohol dehydrogenase-like predicted oxidoreductase